MADQISKIVDVTITRQTSAPSMASFSEHCVVAEFNVAGFDAQHRVKKFGSLQEVVDAGFDLDGFVYKAAAAQFSQSPHIGDIYVGFKAQNETWTAALSAVLQASGDWYGLTCGTREMADQQEIAQWVQANEKLCLLASGDANVVDAETGDIGAYVKANNLDRVGVIYHPDCNDQFEVEHIVYSANGTDFFEDEDLETPATIPSGKTPTLIEGQKYHYFTTETGLNANDPIPEARIFGKMFTKDPGSATFGLKKFEGMSAYDLTGGQVTIARGKNVNTYLKAAGIDVLQEGKTGGEWLDVIRDIDWLKASIQNKVFTVLVNNDKVPFTNAGIQQVVSPLREALTDGANREILASFDVSHPDVSEVSATDKGNRHLPDVKFSGVLAGAIQSTKIQGVATL